MVRKATARRQSLWEHSDRKDRTCRRQFNRIRYGGKTPVVVSRAGVKGRYLAGPACWKPRECLAHFDFSLASMAPASGRARRNAWTTTERKTATRRMLFDRCLTAVLKTTEKSKWRHERR